METPRKSDSVSGEEVGTRTILRGWDWENPHDNRNPAPPLRGTWDIITNTYTLSEDSLLAVEEAICPVLENTTGQDYYPKRITEAEVETILRSYDRLTLEDICNEL
jgi:hypothetical protein